MSKRADFYLLNSANHPERLGVLWRLVNKIHQQQISCLIYCDTEAKARHLDEFLWTFEDDSFLPHAVLGDDLYEQPLIEISFAGLAKSADCFINFSDQVPQLSETFQRIVEIIPNDEAMKTTARQCYKKYRDLGFQVNTHHLT